METNEFTIQTPRHTLTIECLSEIVNRDIFIVHKDEYASLCKAHCRNFDNKYSCPPFAPNFNEYQKEYENFLVVSLLLDLNQLKGYSYSEFQRQQIGSAVLKPRIDKLVKRLESEETGKAFSSGACRLCKPCERKKGLPCRYPDDRRYSLEACGVDCSSLMKKVFSRSLEWYKDKHAPMYTSVIVAIPLKNLKYDYQSRLKI